VNILFNEGALLEAILKWNRARAGRKGETGPADGLVAKVERREAQRPTSLGARGWRYQLREAKPTSSQGCPVSAPWRLPPLHPRRRGSLARRLGKTRTHCAARMRGFGCLNLRNQNLSKALTRSQRRPRERGDPYAVSPVMRKA
jgi:hypothetical protein